MKKFTILVLIIMLLCGCKKNQSVDDLIKNNNYVILDVRTEDEYQEKHIKDAINIPYDLIDEDINLEKDQIIFVYCKSGKRASIAKEMLENLGYEVYNLGGINDIDMEKEES